MAMNIHCRLFDSAGKMA